MTQTVSLAPSRSYWHVVGRQLRQDPVALASACVLLCIVLAAVLAPWLAPARLATAVIMAWQRRRR